MTALDDWLRPIRTEERARLILRDLARHAGKDALAVLAACDRIAEALRDRLPAPVYEAAAPSFGSAREDAAIWADVASDGQVAAMLIACLDRIGGRPVAIADRKRLLVAVWNGLPASDRRAFVARVAAEKTD